MLSIVLRIWRTRSRERCIAAAHCKSHQHHQTQQSAGIVACRMPSRVMKAGIGGNFGSYQLTVRSPDTIYFFQVGQDCKAFASSFNFSTEAVHKNSEGDKQVNLKIHDRMECDDDKYNLKRINAAIRRKGWMPETGKQLEMLKLKLSPGLVCDVVVNQKDLNLARNFFKWAGQQEGYRHTIRTYSLMIKRLAGAKESQAVLHLLESMWKEGCKISPQTITGLLRTYGKVNNLPGALEVFNQMQQFGCHPSINVCNCLIDLLVRGGFHHTAIIVLGKMSQLGVKPDIRTFRILVHGFNRAGRLDLATKSLKGMMQAGINPGVFTFTALIDALTKSKDVEEACEIFKEMKKLRCSPNVVTYTALVNGLTKSGRLEEACELFVEMKANNCSPDAIAYNTLIDGVGKAGEADMACGLFKEM